MTLAVCSNYGFYLGDPEKIKAAAQAVKDQTKVTPRLSAPVTSAKITPNTDYNSRQN